MSVPKTKRGEGRLVSYKYAEELAVYTLKICSNEKHFPKRYRWCLTNKITDTALEIYSNVMQMDQQLDSYEERKDVRDKRIAEALSQIDYFLSLLDIAYQMFNVSSDQLTNWLEKVDVLRNSLVNRLN